MNFFYSIFVFTLSIFAMAPEEKFFEVSNSNEDFYTPLKEPYKKHDEKHDEKNNQYHNR